MSLIKIKRRLTPRELMRTVRKMLERGKDMRPWLMSSGLQLLSSVQINFRQGGRPKWQGLKLNTLIRRGATPGGGGRPKTLLDTGRLANSILTGSDAPGPVRNPLLKSGGNMLKLTKRAITVGTNVAYAKYHQFGLGVPQREFLLLQKRDVEVIGMFAEEYIQGDL